MVKEKYVLFLFLAGVMLNVLVLAALVLHGQRLDTHLHLLVNRNE